jgi:hypothetical protein
MAINGYEKLIMIMREQSKKSASPNGTLMIGEAIASNKIKIGDLVFGSDEVLKLAGVTFSKNDKVLCTFIDDEVYIIGKLQ